MYVRVMCVRLDSIEYLNYLKKIFSVSGQSP